VRASLRGTGVTVSGPVDPVRPTGLLLRSARTAALCRVYYYRRESAGAALTIDDLKEPLARRPRTLHATGITPTLSPQARAATAEAMSLAHDAGTTVSYDVNYRSRLTTVDDAAAVLREVVDDIDILFCSEDELPVVTTALGCPDSALATALAAVAPELELVVKQGRRGALVHTAGSTVFQPAVDVPAVDVVGAGDAFVAGYLSARLDGLDIAERLARGVQLGAFCVCSHGDWEGLPTRAELGLLDTPPDFTDR
jgi:2-dehydro-3-deoxygluconokinase